MSNAHLEQLNNLIDDLDRGKVINASQYNTLCDIEDELKRLVSENVFLRKQNVEFAKTTLRKVRRVTRSAKTGRWVRKELARMRAAETVTETV